MINLKQQSGITLIALMITIIVLIILAGISVNLILGDGGIIARAQQSNEEYSIAQAREKLELTLGNAQIEKRTNTLYNQNEFLDEFILKELENSQVLGDIVIVDGYAFNIDRSVPKIGEYIGKKGDLIFPEINVDVDIADNYKVATITINAIETTNGINKIQLLQNGEVIEESTYDNVKENITLSYQISRNGQYTIKVYSNLAMTELIKIEELKSNIVFSPNGSTEYKKEHSVKIQLTENVGEVKTMKYQWLETIEEPTSDSFTQTCNNGDTITKNEVTGKWYLWVLLEMESGMQVMEVSEAFYFDNEGPVATLEATPISETSFSLTTTVTEEKTQVEKYEFYVKDELKQTVETSEKSAIANIENIDMGTDYNSYVIITDILGNTTKQTVTARTLVHTWKKFSLTTVDEGYYVETYTNTNYNIGTGSVLRITSSPKFNNATGKWFASSSSGLMTKGNYKIGCFFIKNSNCWIRRLL